MQKGCRGYMYEIIFVHYIPFTFELVEYFLYVNSVPYHYSITAYYAGRNEDFNNADLTKIRHCKLIREI